MVESPSSQPKGPEQQYYVSALQYGRVVLIKENVATRRQNMQERERERESRILRNTLTVKFGKYVRFQWKGPLYEIALGFLQFFWFLKRY